MRGTFTPLQRPIQVPVVTNVEKQEQGSMPFRRNPEWASSTVLEGDNEDEENGFEGDVGNATTTKQKACWQGCGNGWWTLQYYDPTPWLMEGLHVDSDDGIPYFDERSAWTMAGWVRRIFYNPISPEFTSLQQFCWAIVIGVAMGFYTAGWKILLDSAIEVLWVSIPARLLAYGVFTSLDGWFPQYHYMWIVPTIFAAVLSYVFVAWPVKIPDQNKWISSLHESGFQDYRTFWPLFVLSTLGMMSGLSLGPELPLVLTSGMLGSWLGMACQQSVLQVRVLNLTAASAAIGGFFGFPMAGALFVLELPHRSGLQYFEAMTPSIMSSIVAVITNRLIIQNDVTGYFKYPFLANSLPSSTFSLAIVYGFYGCAIGVLYLILVVRCKTWVHDCFHKKENLPPPDHQEHEESTVMIKPDVEGMERELDVQRTEPDDSALTETSSFLANEYTVKTTDDVSPQSDQVGPFLPRICPTSCFVILNEAHRAAVAGALAGFICGWVAIFVPHTLFWGESQLQNLIDKGRTPLPVFGDYTSDMTALGYCIINRMDPAAGIAGFSAGCSALIAVSKTVVIGLSLGTGIIGGHFWGPLFVGCAASHFFADIMKILDKSIGFGKDLGAFPCLVILCTMGAAHVVSFRSHTAIMLILTLTISTFSPQDENPYFGMAGDYAAVFPLLVISVFLSMILSRNMVFYKEQRNRDDILAVPQALCQPVIQDDLSVGSLNGVDEGHSRDGSRRSSAITYGDSGTPNAKLSEMEAAQLEGVLQNTNSAYGSVDAINSAKLTAGNLAGLTPSGPDENLAAAPDNIASSLVNSSNMTSHLFEQARVHRRQLSGSEASGSEFGLDMGSITLP